MLGGVLLSHAVSGTGFQHLRTGQRPVPPVSSAWPGLTAEFGMGACEGAQCAPYAYSGLSTQFIMGSGASEISVCLYFPISPAGPEDILDRDNNAVRTHTILWLPERNVPEKCDKH